MTTKKSDTEGKDFSSEKDPAGRWWAFWVSAAVMAATFIPIIVLISYQGKDPFYGWYTWAVIDPQDIFCYFGWMRQGANGSLLAQSLHTTIPQAGYFPNLFFHFLGFIAGLLHLPFGPAFHLARVFFGILYLMAFWRFLELIIDDRRCRKVCFLVLVTSAGLGWLTKLIWADGLKSVDYWQPESVTFFTLYLSPHFAASLLLMMGAIIFLLLAERENSTKYAVYAGVCGLLLGNIHTYDVATLTFVWGTYLVVQSIIKRRWKPESWRRALIAGGMSAISTGYMYYITKTDYVMGIRSQIQTLSNEFYTYLLGYGLTLILAIAGLYLLLKSRKQPNSADSAMERRTAAVFSDDGLILMACWLVVGFIIVYLPVQFQRRMLMGHHMPVSIFAGYFIYYLLRNLKSWKWAVALASILLILSPTNLILIYRGTMKRIPNNGFRSDARYYLYRGELASLEWIRKNVPRDVVVQPLPWIKIINGGVVVIDDTLAAFIPGYTGNKVNAGQYGETPDFELQRTKWIRFLLPRTPESASKKFIKESGVRYIIFSQKNILDTNNEIPLISNFLFKKSPSFLRYVPEASNTDADVYEVLLEKLE